MDEIKGATQMKLLLLICTMWLVAICSSWAEDQQKRFLEFPDGNSTKTFDLGSVQMIGPGRFTINNTAIDDPDVMKLKLKVLDFVQNRCALPEGKYRMPSELFTLGSPDMPVENIEITHNQSNSKLANWAYPYKRLAVGSDEARDILFCNRQSEFIEKRTIITNGIQSKYLYDCKRGLQGIVFDGDDPTKAVTGFVRANFSMAFLFYMSVCQAVTHEEPYVPN